MQFNAAPESGISCYATNSGDCSPYGYSRASTISMYLMRIDPSVDKVDAEQNCYLVLRGPQGLHVDPDD